MPLPAIVQEHVLRGNDAMTVDAFVSFTLAILLLFVGKGLSARIGVLRRYGIPEPVVGGVLCAAVVCALYYGIGLRVDFGLGARDLLLLYFFAALGLNSNVRALASGGRLLVLLAVLASLFMLLQNGLGMAMAGLFGMDPRAGLMVGSVSLTGGVGTTLAWTPHFTETLGIAGASELGLAANMIGLVAACVIGGPIAEKEFAFPGCERVSLLSAREAAAFAFERDVALVICHTPPYFTIPTLIGGHIPVIAYDYGEPPAELFPDPTRSYLLDVEYDKRAAASLTTTIATISQAVKDETMNADAVVVGLANSHLPSWTDLQRKRREEVRRTRGWSDRFVVLTVCRFSENERVYKGLDRIARIVREFSYLHPEQALGLTWALAGAGSEDDVKRAEALGFTVFPNVPDDELTGLYTAADAYMGFSRWEGYNLGISQALAMGLPTLASDIPAHREFPIETTNSTLVATRWLSKEIDRREQANQRRTATVYEWEASSARFAELVETTLRKRGSARARTGSYATRATS